MSELNHGDLFATLAVELFVEQERYRKSNNKYIPTESRNKLWNNVVYSVQKLWEDSGNEHNIFKTKYDRIIVTPDGFYLDIGTGGNIV